MLRSRWMRSELDPVLRRQDGKTARETAYSTDDGLKKTAKAHGKGSIHDAGARRVRARLPRRVMRMWQASGQQRGQQAGVAGDLHLAAQALGADDGAEVAQSAVEFVVDDEEVELRGVGDFFA